MKLMIFDGLDNCGKTWTINKLINYIEENQVYLKYDRVAFPSKELCSSDVFKNMVKPENRDNDEVILEFVNSIIADVKKGLIQYIKEGLDVLFIDRMMLSTLIYQGGTNNKRIDHIVKLYSEMFESLEIKPSDVTHLIFKHKINDFKIEHDPSKLEFDKRYHEFRIGYDHIVKPQFLQSKPYLSSFYIFDEVMFYNREYGSYFNTTELNELDESRISIINYNFLDQLNIESDPEPMNV